MGKHNTTGVTLDFPLETQFMMLRRFLPEERFVGVLYNPQENGDLIPNASKHANKHKFILVAEEVVLPRDLPAAMDKLVDEVDVLWSVTDRTVMRPQTARQILLFSYRNRIPLVGLSSKWVKSGALYSLDRDYEDIGAQCGEMAIKVLNGSSVDTIPPETPRKLLYSINLKTARHMKLKLPDSLINNASNLY
jgi:putative ABC transport system substrate-binding protein